MKDLIEDLDGMLLSEDSITRLLTKITKMDNKGKALKQLETISYEIEKLMEDLKIDILKQGVKYPIMTIEQLELEDKYLVIQHKPHGRQSIAKLYDDVNGFLKFKPIGHKGKYNLEFYSDNFCGCGSCRFDISKENEKDKVEFYKLN